jgi:hypothetical protein
MNMTPLLSHRFSLVLIAEYKVKGCWISNFKFIEVARILYCGAYPRNKETFSLA